MAEGKKTSKGNKQYHKIGKQNAVIAKNRMDNLIMPCIVRGVKCSAIQLSLINVEKFIDSNRKQLQISQWVHIVYFAHPIPKMAWNDFPHLECFFVVVKKIKNHIKILY